MINQSRKNIDALSPEDQQDFLAWMAEEARKEDEFMGSVERDVRMDYY